MASSSNPSHIMEELVIEEELEEGLVLQDLGEGGEDEFVYDWRLCLVGRFISTGAIDFPSMQQTLAALWKPGKGVYIKKLDVNRFLFQFYHEIDIKRVVAGSPWYFNRKALIISRMKEESNPRCLTLNTLDVWVQLHDLKTGFMTSTVLKAVGNYVGVFVDACPKNFLGVWRDYMRIRVTIDLAKPLKRRMCIRKTGKEWIWITFKYENIPTFCFICGILGHSERFCPKLFETPEHEITKPYGDWMKAPFRRSTKLIGEQWLRNGGHGDTARRTGGGENHGGFQGIEGASITTEFQGANVFSTNRGKGIIIADSVDPHFSHSNPIAGTIMTDMVNGLGSNTELGPETDDDNDQKRPNFIFLCETLCKKEKVERFKHAIGFEGMITAEVQGRSGGIAFLWRFQEEAFLQSYDHNHIDMVIKVQGWPEFRLTGIYGEPDRTRRHLTWQLINDLSLRSSLPWCLIGDMNNVLSQTVKKGGRPYPNWLLQGFQDVLSSCNLIDMDMEGYPYTWERGKGTANCIEIRLDRALVSPTWMDNFQDAKLVNYEISTSDHSPLFLDPIMRTVAATRRKFKFENAWLREPMCRTIVESAWSSTNDQPLTSKITHCSTVLAEWGKDITGNFQQRIAASKKKLKSLKRRRDECSIQMYQEEKKHLFETFTQKEVFWRQRSKQLWLKEGDQNSKYFHAVAKTRRRNNHIRSIQNEFGQVIDWESGIQEVMISYFQNLFTPSITQWDDVVDCIPRTISQLQNEQMLAPIDDKEVQDALFQMHPDKSPGPDGMSPGFYQKFWGIVGKDVVKLVTDFFATGIFEANLPNTNIVLVPKKKNPKSMLDLRPISLCNVLYKIVSKVLANRLKKVLYCVISENQSAFIPGRLITDNIMVSFEIMHYMKRKSSGKNGVMAMKLDMSKAYDRVEWGYLQAILQRMGFDDHMVKLFMACVSTAKYQVSHAGKEFGNIIPGRGLRQGDPLSSYLFIICTEGLSALIRHYEQRHLIRGIKVARGAPIVSHIFFADDSYIFCRANEEESYNVLQLLNTFERASGQKINYDKSSIFFSRNTQVGIRDAICGDLGIHEADDNTTYLGLPNIIGRKKTAILGYLKERVQKRVQSWKGKLLSKAGKEVLLKTVAQALPNYAMSVFLLPAETSKEMERIMCKFWWQSNNKKDKSIHWMSWERMCKPKSHGGLGFRSLYDFNVALLGKQAWRLLSYPNSLVSKIYKARYFPNCSFLAAEIGGNPSFIWRSMMEALPLIKQGAALRVGSGSAIDILQDPWLPDEEDPFVHTVSESLKGKSVSQLMQVGNRQWDLEILQDIFIDRDINLIVTIPLHIEDADAWYWRNEKLGHYSVKSAYKVLQDIQGHTGTTANSGFWRKLWNLKVPPKVKNFLWQASTNCLPTKTQLKIKHVPIDDKCPFCLADHETINHVLVLCPFSQACWAGLNVGDPGSMQGSFADWLLQMFEKWSGHDRYLISMLCWSLWKSRNSLVWNQKSVEVADVLVLTRTTLNQWIYAQDRQFDPSFGLMNSEDGNEHWQVPKENTIKINTDVAIFESTTRYSYSCVARDHAGRLVEAQASCRQGAVKPEIAEAVGILEALSWIKQQGWRDVEVESDCLVAIQSIRSSSTMDSYFGRVVSKCKDLLIELKHKFISLKFVKRSANNGAHFLARSTCFIADRILRESNAPAEFISVLMNDLN
uniref:Reverse transcriptase domain-containing protein n=1 Tax=Cannabis sativa TaxID=3483 RepID=A0A803QFT1_CANSA